MSYTAHITTAADLGAPEVIVFTDDGLTALVAYPLAADTDPTWVLQNHGWTVHDDFEEVSTGYLTVTVEPLDVEGIVARVTHEKARAVAELDRQDTAWRRLIHDAMHGGASATRLAEAAGVSRERVYQIRDGRR